MRQFIGTTLIGMVLIYVMIRDKVATVSADLMNEALDADRQKKISARCR